MEAHYRNELNFTAMVFDQMLVYNILKWNLSQIQSFEAFLYPELWRNAEYFQQRIARVNIYYDNLGFTSIQERPETTVNTLIAAVGGNLGLFIGMSLISLIEIVELAYHICVNTLF
jgi:hypothetical protein